MPPFFLSRLGADKTALRSLKRQGRFQQTFPPDGYTTRVLRRGAPTLDCRASRQFKKGPGEEALGQFAAEKLGDMIDALKLRFCKKNSSELDRTFQNYDFFDDR
jgi:hypothetical protein